MQDQIRYVKRKDIDTQKWDECIRNSPNGIIYAYVFYLDCMADHWDALICNDYEAIMPLTWRKKYGVTYLYQPFFTQQSGIFSQQPVTASIVAAFLSESKTYFRFAEIHLNFGNSEFEGTRLNNFILSLTRPYEEICLSYKKDLKKNLLRSKKFKLIYHATPDYNSAISKFRMAYSKRLKNNKQSDYNRLKKLCMTAHEKQLLLIREVRNNENEILATALCLNDGKRIYQILSVTSQKGKKYEANHFLIDHLIREFQRTDLLLDFEGSDIPGIAHFYKNFGSVNQPYFFFRFNNLPWPFRLLKK